MSELDSFLTAGTQPPDPGAPAPAPAAEPTPAPAAKQDTAKSEPAKTAPDPPAPDPDDDIADHGGMIPASTFHKARTDWKTKTVAAETEARLLREQIEAFKRQPPPQPPQPQQHQPPPEPLDPVRDPVGYHNRLQSVLLNDRLNLSEMLEREKHPPEAFEAAVQEFQQAAAQQPELYSKLHAQRHPYGWLMKEIEKLRITRELGDDPAGYKAKLRAEWEAEQQANGGAAPVSPAAGLPPSLATTRSAAPRSANAFSGPPALDDIFRREPKRR